MKASIPTWAMRTAGPEDQGVVQDAHRRGTLQITWPNLDVLRDWARRQGWPTPWFSSFEKAFITRMLESEESFKLAIDQSGIEIQIPRRDFIISMEKLRELDALYEEYEGGRPVRWGGLVEELREIRRAVEAGVVVEVEGTRTLRTWQDFYDWAHGRYHMLEDGYDKWIGDDRS